ncbi:MAG: head decoration protein [Acidobacteriota bacterium]
MSTLTEGKVPGDWLKGEQHEPTDYSREVITILAGSGATRPLTSGMVLAKISKGAATVAAAAGNTGNGTSGSVTLGAAAIPGVYRLSAIAATKFLVEDPNGAILGTLTTGVLFAAGGLSFTLTAGGTAFVVGDAFTITVAAGSGKYVQIDDDGLLGSEDAAGILYQDVTAPDGADVKGVAIVRNAVVSANGLTWPVGDFDDNEKAAAVLQLAALGIIVREGA